MWTIRRAEPTESARIADVMVSARHAAVPAIPPPVHTDDEIREWFASVVMVEAEVWVAAEGDSILALMVLTEGWIDQLYVLPGRLDGGIGSALIDHAKSAHDEFDLWTFESNAGARRFYERHGFVAVDRTDGDNEEGAPDVRYRWSR